MEVQPVILHVRTVDDRLHDASVTYSFTVALESSEANSARKAFQVLKLVTQICVNLQVVPAWSKPIVAHEQREGILSVTRE